MGNAFKNLTEKQIEEIPTLAATLTTEQIADYFGICRLTFYEMRKRNPVINLRYKLGRAKKVKKYIDKLDEHIFNANAKGNVAALIFAAKTYCRWSEYNNAFEDTETDIDAAHTPEELEEKRKDIKFYLECKKQRRLSEGDKNEI